MRNSTTRKCVALSVFLLLAASASGETRYVSSEGSTESPFTSWKTAARDIASALDPHFRSRKDFRLRPDSPCIDAGRNEDWMIEAVDAAGRPRIQNKVVEIGAYEFDGSTEHVNKWMAETGPIQPSTAPVISAADLTSGDDDWIGLAPLVRADRDLKDAGWAWDGRSAAFSAGKPRAFVTIPLRIAGSYELQTRVTITRAKEVTAIYLPISDTRAVILGMRGDRGNSESPTATIQMTGLKPEAEKPGDVSMDIGTDYAFSCKVLIDGDNVALDIRRDGRVLFQWAGDVEQVAETSLMRPRTVQLETAYYTTSRFTDLRLRMLSGEAFPLFSPRKQVEVDKCSRRESPERSAETGAKAGSPRGRFSRE